MKVKTLSSEPDKLSQKDIERLVSIVCDYASKYHILYADQRRTYQGRQNHVQRRMRANLIAALRSNTAELQQAVAGAGYPFGVF